MSSLFKLPGELLSNILEYLLPQVNRTDLDEVYVLKETGHLFDVRAACRGLCEVATPLAWRRLRLRIRATDVQGRGHLTSAPNPQLLSSFAAPGVRGSYPSRAQAGHPVRPRPLDPYVPFILDHCDLASHTRFLILDFPEWDSDNYALSQCAGRIAGSLNSFKSLRVLFVLSPALYAPPTFLSAFMRLPQRDLALHISQCRIDPTGLPPSISSVKYLQFTECIGTFPAIAHAHSLTHLWLERCLGDSSAASQLSWHSLISVRICDCPDQFWVPFFAGFSVSVPASLLPRLERFKFSTIVSEMRVQCNTKAYSCFFLTLSGISTSRRDRAIDRIECRESPELALPRACFRHSGNFQVSAAD